MIMFQCLGTSVIGKISSMLINPTVTSSAEDILSVTLSSTNNLINVVGLSVY